MTSASAEIHPGNARFLALVHAAAWGASACVIAVGCLVLLGWAADLPLLTTIFGGSIAMNPLTAVAFIVAGAGLAASLGGEVSRRLARICGGGVAALGVTVLCGYLFRWEAGIDQFLFGSKLDGNVMAPTTALGLALSGTALALIDMKTDLDWRPTEFLAACAGLVALLALTGYAYQVEKFYRLGTFIAMAMHTAAILLIFSAGLLCARPDGGAMARFSSSGPGGTMLRRLLGAIIGVPLALGWLIMFEYRAGAIDAGVGFSIFVLIVVVFVAAMIWRNALSLDAKDAGRTLAETKLRRAHEALEGRIIQRTSELCQVLETIREGVNVLGSSTQQILASTSQLARTATESASSVTETTATAEEVRQTAHLSSREARRVAATAQRTADISRAGQVAIEASAAGMNRIREEMESIAGSMLQLNEQSQAIGEIIAAVDEISEQSNLLAVNAAIQAARAGEHGRGFAVVADEMKYLAGESRQATRQVRTILSDIQTATGAAAMTIEQASKAVDSGVRESADAGRSIVELAAQIGDAARAAAQIAVSAEQQVTGMDHVARAMQQIKEASLQNVEQASQLEHSARGLNALGQQLKELVARYQDGRSI